MNYRIIFRKAHRYLGLVVSLQLLCWSIGGFYFTLYPIEEIHGDHLIRNTETHRLASCPHAQGLSQISFDKEDVPGEFSTLHGPAGIYWRVRFQDHVAYYDYCSGKRVSPLSQDSVKQIALDVAPAAGLVSGLHWITEVEKDSEYRGKPLPVWRVEFDGEDSLHLYLDAFTGKVVTARTESWRIFDFFWMLHIMDYETRDNFNHSLLQFFALLAVITSFSGLLLWWISNRRYRK